MKCPNCNFYHNSQSPKKIFQYHISGSNFANKDLSLCMNCGVFIKDVTPLLKKFAVNAILFVFGIGTFIGVSILFYEDFPGWLQLPLAILFLTFFCYLVITIPNRFANYEIVEDKSFEVSLYSIKKPGLKIFTSYLIIVTLLNLLVFNMIDLEAYKSIWTAIIAVVYFGLILYIGGLIIVKFTDITKKAGSKIDL